jgi:hypothetical protein
MNLQNDGDRLVEIGDRARAHVVLIAHLWRSIDVSIDRQIVGD